MEEKNKRAKLGVTKKCIGSVAFSWNVFMSFVEVGTDGTPDATKVFSRECYKKWVETRMTKKLKCPEQSFQRVLYAHIRGADRRKPFPAEIEAELLKLLRKNTESLFKKLNGESKHKTGVRGFNQLGFHERLKMLKEKREKQEKDIMEVLVPKEELKLDVKKKLGVTPFDLMWQTFEYWIPEAERKPIISAALERGIDIHCPALRFFLQEAPSQLDLRYNFHFMLPPEQDCYFSPDASIAHLIVDKRKVCIHEDENAVKFFQKSTLNKHLFEITGSLVNLMFAQIVTIPAFYQGGKILWRRSSFRRDDGSVGFFLFKIVERNNDGLAHYYLEDVSDRYQDLASRPEFF